jgi:universal stress protein A
VDFSEWSSKALQYAGSLAEESAGLLLAVHVIDALHAERLTAYPSFDITSYVKHIEDDARARLQQAIPAGTGRASYEALLAHGRPHEEIVRIARERDAHLIVIGVHGRPAVDLMLLGSTTHHVIRTAPCPVLTLRK